MKASNVNQYSLFGVRQTIASVSYCCIEYFYTICIHSLINRATPPTPTTNIGMDSHRYHQEHLTPHRRNSRNSRRTMKQDKLYDSDTDLSCEETVNGVCNMLSPRSKLKSDIMNLN